MCRGESCCLQSLRSAEGVAKMKELNSEEEINDVVEVTDMDEEPGNVKESDKEEAAEEADPGTKRKTIEDREAFEEKMDKEFSR